MRRSIIPILALLLTACSPKEPSDSVQTGSAPHIFPDYTDVTIPGNIAPTNFLIEEVGQDYVTVLQAGSDRVTIGGNSVRIPFRKWQKLTQSPEIKVTVYVQKEGKWNHLIPYHPRGGRVL